MSVASFVDAHVFLAKKKNDGEKWNIIPIRVRGFKKIYTLKNDWKSILVLMPEEIKLF